MSASIPARRLHRAVANLDHLQRTADDQAADLRETRREIRKARTLVADALAAMPALPATPADLARVGAIAQPEPPLVTRATSGRRA